MSPDRDQIRKETEAEFAELEKQAAHQEPGLEDMLKVYGGYEQAVEQADQYFDALYPAASCITKDDTRE